MRTLVYLPRRGKEEREVKELRGEVIDYSLMRELK